MADFNAIAHKFLINNNMMLSFELMTDLCSETRNFNWGDYIQVVNGNFFFLFSDLIIMISIYTICKVMKTTTLLVSCAKIIEN